ncbi:hypothetical protein C8J57DRAFT_1484686 [Mycena rebaudengoi]|nr:hypothetical protein C8J57DRAFT_1484686 [Mycena rebaudengoi]
MPASTSQPSSSPFVKRRRAYVACTNCRQRKVRCVSLSEVGDEPCNRCSKRGLKCEYIAIPDCQETSSEGDSTTTPEPLSGSNSPDGLSPAPYTSVSSSLPMDPSYSRRRSSHYANVAESSYYTPSKTPPLRPVSSQSASDHLSPGPYPSLPYAVPLARKLHATRTNNHLIFIRTYPTTLTPIMSIARLLKSTMGNPNGTDSTEATAPVHQVSAIAAGANVLTCDIQSVVTTELIEVPNSSLDECGKPTPWGIDVPTNVDDTVDPISVVEDSDVSEHVASQSKKIKEEEEKQPTATERERSETQGATCGTQYYVVSTYGDLQLLPKLTYGRLFVRPSEAYKTCSNKLHQFTMHAISSCSLRIFKDDKEIFIMTLLRGASGATFLVTLFGAVFDRIRENARGVLNSKLRELTISNHWVFSAFPHLAVSPVGSSPASKSLSGLCQMSLSGTQSLDLKACYVITNVQMSHLGQKIYK